MCRGGVIQRDSVKELLFTERDRVVFKKDHSSRGMGIRVFDRKSFNIETVESLGNGLFQEFIIQDEMMAQFQPQTVIAIRLTTISLDSGVVELRGSYLKVGLAGEPYTQSDNQLRVAIDRDSGAFSDHGHSTDWKRVETHPDSGIRFSGKVVPSYDRCKDLVERLHSKIPYVRCIGWDLAVDEAGEPQVLEWNGGHNDIKYSEATQGPCFADLGWETLWRQ